jgi:hypothetical protein
MPRQAPRGGQPAIVRGTVGGRAAIDPFRKLAAVDVEVLAKLSDRVTPATNEVVGTGDVATIAVVATPELPRQSRSPQRSPHGEKHEGGTSALHLGGRTQGMGKTHTFTTVEPQPL